MNVFKEEILKTDDLNSSVKLAIAKRMSRRIKFDATLVRILGTAEYCIAGNSCNASVPNDYDVYVLGDSMPRSIESMLHEANNCDNVKFLSKTRNALTLDIDGQVVQICRYTRYTLQDLVESFDYAHIKIGVCILNDKIVKVYYSHDWELAHLTGESWYVEPKNLRISYPLSSLIRAGKYYKKGELSWKAYHKACINAIDAVLRRGFSSYDDFKDQLDAIDMLSIEDRDSVMSLYETFELYGIARED